MQKTNSQTLNYLDNVYINYFTNDRNSYETFIEDNKLNYRSFSSSTQTSENDIINYYLEEIEKIIDLYMNDEECICGDCINNKYNDNIFYCEHNLHISCIEKYISINVSEYIEKNFYLTFEDIQWNLIMKLTCPFCRSPVNLSILLEKYKNFYKNYYDQYYDFTIPGQKKCKCSIL